MITWIQRTFQRHLKLVFAIVLLAFIIPLVFVVTPGAGIGGQDGRITDQEFFGANLVAQADQKLIFGDASLSLYLRIGQQIPSDPRVQQFALSRYAALHLADELRLPDPSADEAAEFIRTLRLFAGETGQFDPKTYASFRDSLKLRRDVTEADLFRVIRDDWRIQRVQELLGGPGYVLPYDIETTLVQTDTTWTIGVATIDYTSFQPTISTDDAALTKFFEENTFRYELPPQVVVEAAFFPSSAFTTDVTVTDAEIRAYYDANPARFPKPATPTTGPTAITTDLPTAGSDDFILVRSQVESALRLERAADAAARVAADFTMKVFDNKPQPGSPDLTQLAQSYRGTIRAIPPFSRGASPAELGSDPANAEAAFRLSADRYFSDPLVVPGGAAVLIYRSTEPARTPLLTEVRAKVATDYTENERRRRFSELGNTLRTELRAKLQAGTSLADAATQLAGTHSLKIESATPAAFTLRQPPTGVDYAALSALERLKAGDVSELIIAGDKGHLVQVVSAQAPEIFAGSALYTSTREQLATFGQSATATGVLDQLVADELARTDLTDGKNAIP